MKGNTFGRNFRITSWGESHGKASGVIIDGCPAGIEISSEDFLATMSKRRGGQSNFDTPRAEPDLVEIESGVFEGRTTGTPISLRIANTNTRSQDYEQVKNSFRPGHADLSTYLKHDGYRDYRGGGRSSARETAARVAAGVIAAKILEQKGVAVFAFLRRVGDMPLSPERVVNFHNSTSREIYAAWDSLKKLRDLNKLKLPLEDISAYEQKIENAVSEGNSLGGSIECWVKGLQAGLGEPVFEKLNAQLAQAMMSLPAAVAFESGGGQAMSRDNGSEIRDPIIWEQDQLKVSGNRHGGLLGGMTTGEPLWLAVDFHAPTSIPQKINSVDIREKKAIELSVQGRHDSFPLPRAIVVVEAMVSIVLADAYLSL